MAKRSKIEKRWPNHAELRKTIKAGVECRFLKISAGYIPASRCLIATTPDMGFPVGTVWYALRDSSTVCEILTSWESHGEHLADFCPECQAMPPCSATRSRRKSTETTPSAVTGATCGPP